MKKIDLAVATLWTPDISSWCRPFSEIKSQYCTTWGFSYHVYEESLEPLRAPTWSKIKVIQQHLQFHEWILWLDADTTITNPNFNVAELCEPDFDLIITKDHNGFNAGVFLIRNTSTSHEFLKKVWDRNINHHHFEQTAMAQVMIEMPDLCVKEIRKNCLNSYWNDFQYGDFVLHTAGESNENKNKLLTLASNIEASERRMSKLPKKIWQTYSSAEKLPPESVACLESWRIQNPEWEVIFQNDCDIRALFENHLPLYLEIFDSLPLGVMKADFWRYAVIFIHGGLYADIDTVCNLPLDSWLVNEIRSNLNVACENNHPFFCQWSFACPAGHPALLEVLELIVSRVGKDGGVDRSRENFVHYYTGPGVWTAAIQEYLVTTQLPESIHHRSHLKMGKNITTYPPGAFTWEMISHSNASYNWKEFEYDSWRVASGECAPNSSR